jgi:thymidine kinase
MHDVVAIDETHFFDDVYDFLIAMEKSETRKTTIVVMACLSGDSDRKRWTTMDDVYPLMDEIKHCKAYCVDCGDGTEAPFSKCLVQKNTKELIGNSYKAVCRRHLQCTD